MGQSKLASGYPDWTVVANQSTTFSSGNWVISNQSNTLVFVYSSSSVFVINSSGKITTYDGLTTVGLGVPAIYGSPDNRKGITAVDSSALTIYTPTAATQLYTLSARILATAGTTPAATYTIKWTEGGVVITKTLSISALDSDSDLMVLIQPDNATAITAQLTAISGTSTTVNVACAILELI